MSNTSKFFGAGQRRAQTRLKHAILENYLAAFAGKTGSKSLGGNVGFLDGYAGPGSDISKSTGLVQDGSPAIAIRVARGLTAVNPPKNLHCVFIEASEENFAGLKRLVDSATDVDAVALPGRVTTHVAAAMDRFSHMPVLVFLDPFGIGLDRETCLNTVLGRSRDQPTELILNFSLEAVRRAGPYVKKPESFAPRAAMLRTMDTWLGGDWWQPMMLDTDPADSGAIDRAANAIAEEYARRLSVGAGCDVFTVPMRRSATHKALFSLMLFHPRAYAKYTYNEAVSYAQKQWREAMRGIEIARAEREYEEDPILGQKHVSQVQLISEMEEVQLEEDWRDTIYENLKAALANRASLSMDKDFEVIFAGVKGGARGTHFRKAWDRLAKEGLAEKCLPKTRYDYAVVSRAVQSSPVIFRPVGR
jgi:three-Cys-motif partner protein